MIDINIDQLEEIERVYPALRQACVAMGISTGKGDICLSSVITQFIMKPRLDKAEEALRALEEQERQRRWRTDPMGLMPMFYCPLFVLEWAKTPVRLGSVLKRESDWQI